MELPDQDNIDREYLKGKVLDHWGFLAASFIFLIALYLRYLPEQGMAYLQALDPFVIFKMSQHLAFEGSLPAVDFMRYFPYNTPTAYLNMGNIFVPSILYYLGPFLFFENYLEWAQFYPALMGSLSVFISYLLGKEIFDDFTGVSIAFFTAVIPGIMHRTSAGFFEKEPIGTFFMMVSLLLFTRAWKRKEWISGIGSGLALGFFSISWGGSSMLWLLYPLVTGIMLWINEDIRNLVIAYTPTVLIGAMVASALNPDRFWFTSSTVLANFGLVGFLWSRHLLGELEILNDRQLGYYVPAVSLTGLFAVLLSPLYSPFIFSKFQSLMRKVSQSGGDVVAGTVAENAPSSISQMAGQLGARSAGNLHSVIQGPEILTVSTSQLMTIVGSINGGWTLAMLGIPVITSYIAIMVLRKQELIKDKISGEKHLALIESSLAGWFILVIGFFLSNRIEALGKGYAIIGAVVAFSLMTAMAIYFDGEDAFNLNTMAYIFVGFAAVAASIGVNSNPIVALIGFGFAQAILFPIFLSLVGIGIIYYMDQMRDLQIQFHWYYLLPLLWGITNILGAVARSRLVFLSSFSAAFLAGYGFSVGIKRFRSMEKEAQRNITSWSFLAFANLLLLSVLTTLSNSLGLLIIAAVLMAFNGMVLYYWETDVQLVEKQIDLPLSRGTALVGLAILITFGANFSAGLVTANGLGGSPNGLWQQNLEFMENNTPEDSVMLSWWDYGYWFESVGRRAAVADGGNLDYYAGSERKINYPLADFLTNDTEQEQRDFLEKHSVDYIILDETMIGKYSAVSQIHNRNNQDFESMLQLQSGNILNSISRTENNQTAIRFQDRGIRVYAPVEISETGDVSFEAPPTMETSRGRADIGCALTEDGVKEFDNVSRSSRYCVAENPFYNVRTAIASAQEGNPRTAKLALVPKDITDHTLVRLYLMDGYGVDYVEKVPGGSNGFVKMWKVTGQ